MNESRAMQWASKVSAVAESARELTLEAASHISSSSLKSLPLSKETRPGEETLDASTISRLLESRNEREKVDAMRRIIALSSTGHDMSSFFAFVVKNVASPMLELRKMVYIYITMYAESEPDLALLSINTIQKAMSDQNVVVRALALRTMSSIRVSSISGVVLLGIKKGITDVAPYVRRAAASSIPKTFALDPSLEVQLIECIKGLLCDSEAQVLSTALEAFREVCPQRLDLLHTHFRKLCEKLAEMDDFGQSNVLHVMSSYVRQCFCDPDSSDGSTETEREPGDLEEMDDQQAKLDRFYNWDADKTTPKEVFRGSETLDKDHNLFLNSLQPLLSSPTPSTVLAAVRTYIFLSPSSSHYLQLLPSPLVSLLRSDLDIRYVALHNIAMLCHTRPGLFSKTQYVHHFFIWPSDPSGIWKIKLEILSLAITEANAKDILSELSEYSNQLVDIQLAKEAIRTIGRCAARVQTVSDACIGILFRHSQKVGIASVVQSENQDEGEEDEDEERAELLNESVIAIRYLVQLSPDSSIGHIKTLVRSLDSIHAPQARASIFHLVSEYAHLVPQLAPDVLRIGARGFSRESEPARLQILNLAVKLYVQYCSSAYEPHVKEIQDSLERNEDAKSTYGIEAADINGNDVLVDTPGSPLEPERPSAPEILPETDSPVPKLYAYILSLARYDRSYDLRDRLRTYKVLASSPAWILTQKLLFSNKPLPEVTSPFADCQQYTIGSSSAFFGKAERGYTDIPPWSSTLVGAVERNNVCSINNVQKSLRSGISSSKQPSRSSTPHSLFSNDGSAGSGHTKSKSKLTGITSLDEFYATTSEEDASSSSLATDSEFASTDEETEEGISSEGSESGAEYETEEETDDENEDKALVENH